MPGLIGKKVGMTNIYNEAGKSIACTLVEAGPCVVTQVKNEDSDGYRAVQLAYDDKKEKNTSKAEKGHYAKAGSQPKKYQVEFRDFRSEFDDKVALGKEKLAVVAKKMFSNSMSKNHVSSFQISPFFCFCRVWFFNIHTNSLANNLNL